MGNIIQVVDLVAEKLQVLLENYAFLQEENDLLIAKVSSLETQLLREKQQFDSIERDYQSLKIAKTIAGSSKDSTETKRKINALIREIDACISQLSE